MDGSLKLPTLSTFCRKAVPFFFLLGCLWMSLSNVGKSQTQTFPQFRLDTDIYDSLDDKPKRSNLTLFKQGVAYDLDRGNPDVITMVDPIRKRIVLLDATRKIKAEINTDTLFEYVTSAKLELSQDQRRHLMPITQPAIEGNSRAIVQSQTMKYICEQFQKPDDPSTASQVAMQYADFADWSARLNATYPPHLPPFLRMELNALLRQQKALPKEFERIETRDGKELKLTVRLIANWRLSTDDEALIDRIGPKLVTFKAVSPEEFYENPSKPDLAQKKQLQR